MNREEILDLGHSNILTHHCMIAELPTGFGKSKFAIDMASDICSKVFKDDECEANILILVAKTVHKQIWIDEMNKWGGIPSSHIVIECYESLKAYKNCIFDMVICDEAQHLSDRRLEILSTITINYNLLCLSATLPKSIKGYLKYKYNTYCIKTTLQNAIDNEVLPDPTIYLIPLKFDKQIDQTIIRNGGKKLKIVECNFHERWDYYKRTDVEVHVKCTKDQYLQDLNSSIEYYKKRNYNERMKRKWLKLCGDRLKWLAKCKNEYILTMLNYFKDYRTLTFCSSIEQSEILGKNCIHSKNKKSTEVLDKFNKKKIKHITSCNVLNEGVNLVDCRIGIFANLNASDIIVIQRLGRLLRHKDPVIIIPYYPETREEELVNKHLEGYNRDLIHTIQTFNYIQL